MALPPSWKSEVQKAVEEKVDADRNQRQSEQNDAAAKISAAIETISNAQQTQTVHDDRNENINITLALITISLVFLTVVFTGASWWVFSGQLNVMKSDQRPWIKIFGRQVVALGFGPMTNTNMRIKLFLENTGHRPATGIKARFSFHPVGEKADKVLDSEEEAICNKLANLVAGRDTGQTIFPNSQMPIGTDPFEVRMPMSEIQNEPNFIGGDGVDFYIFGCVDYLTSSDGSHGQTGFRYRYWTSVKSPGVATNLDLEHIRLTDEETGNFAR